MHLKEIYSPVKKELLEVERELERILSETRYNSISKITNYLLESSGKRIRPALVILSAKASLSRRPSTINRQLIKIASSIELIHMASLIHDDVVDHAKLRHRKRTINSKWGPDVAIALGDYLYSEAFRLISDCCNPDIIRCISQATKAMCEGELLQICEREDFNLLKERYIVIVKEKTARLFAASCEVGAMLSMRRINIQSACQEYGLNFGIAFQMTDDCLDLVGKEKDLGKMPGADFKMKELTLPVINLVLEAKDKEEIISLAGAGNSPQAFRDLKKRFMDSAAFIKTREDINTYLGRAKYSLDGLDKSCFKESLSSLVDYVGKRIC